MNAIIRFVSPLFASASMFAADPSPAPAPQGDRPVWQVVAKDSKVVFHGSSTLHDFDGTATVSSGRIDLTSGHESGSVTVSATSMDTGNSSRDRTMHADHMESAKFPTIVFTLTSLERADKSVVAHGTWAMHGVSHRVDAPVVLPTAVAPGVEAHLTSSFTLDMRDWNIPVPSTMGMIKVKPDVRVDVDLALAPAAADDSAAAPLAGLLLTDHRGVAHRLGDECRGALVMIFTLDARTTAKRCDDVLSRRLVTAKPLIRIIDGTSFTEAERAKVLERLQGAVKEPEVSFLMDWSGAIRSRLALASSPIQLIGFAADGNLAGVVEGRLDADVLGKALTFIGCPVNPPIAASELGDAFRSRR